MYRLHWLLITGVLISCAAQRVANHSNIPAPQTPSSFGKALPPDFLEGDSHKRSRLDDLLSNPSLPEFTLSNWHNTEPLNWDKLKGKMVLLDFFATWCGPCIRSIPHNNALSKRYADDLVLISVCHTKGAEHLEDIIRMYGIQYPTAVDTDGSWKEHFQVNGFPDYYLIGRNGNILAADIKNAHVEDVGY